jgi:DNA transposition AAA+ family ATPase
VNQESALKKDLHLVPEEKVAKGLPAVTSIGSTIREVLELCRTLRCQGIVTGPSGIGKTREAMRFVDEYAEEVIFVRLGVAVRCLGTLLTLIYEKIGSMYARSNNAFIKCIIEKLEWHPKLLVIDEAHFLTWEMWECLREIHDEAKVGIAYLGQPRLVSQMKGKRGAFLFDQIQGRMAVRRAFGNTVSWEDVRIVADSLHPGLDKKTVSFLHKRCQSDGKLRKAVYVLRVCEEASARDNVPVDYNLVVRVTRSLGL